MQSDPPAVSDTSTIWKLVLAYDGTDFHGWQVQPGHSTIQGELAAAVCRIVGENVLPQGSGRTDAGVHALAQVASFSLTATIPPANLMRALNRTLPSAVRVLSAKQVSPDFHARHSAVGKTYEYRVLVCDPFAGVVCPPWRARYVHAVERMPDFAAMQQAAAAVVGQHDFTSFAASDPDRARRASSATESDSAPSNVRIITASSWTRIDEPEGTLLVYRVSGTGFLHHMVRNLVGTFLDVGAGSIQPSQIAGILAARDRSAAGRTAPARGLFLQSVQYPPEEVP